MAAAVKPGRKAVAWSRFGALMLLVALATGSVTAGLLANNAVFWSAAAAVFFLAAASLTVLAAKTLQVLPEVVALKRARDHPKGPQEQ